MRFDKEKLRNIAAFWLLGLCNNYGYVIMLSAAGDIMANEKGEKGTNTSYCEPVTTSRHCAASSDGIVLVADNVPQLIVQLTFPFFMHRIPFGFRHIFVCLLQVASYFIVAFSTTVPVSLIGVTLAGFSQGIGEATFLAMCSYFPPYTVAAWSSGTGGAGLVGSFAYAFLTQPNMGGLTPKVALLVMLFVPVLFLISYWIVLDIPETVYTPSLHPRTWIIPLDHDQEQKKTGTGERTSVASCEDEKSARSSSENSAVEIMKTHEKVPQMDLTFWEKIKHIVPLLHLMIPLALVYMAEYLINQGLTELIIFNCSQGWHLYISSQYRWYQVLYQLGVFLSRSSVKLFELPMMVIYLLPVLQTANMIFFLFEALYWFVPNIGIMFALIVFEGLLGGAAYVNTYNKIHKKVVPEVREFSMAITSLGNAIGTNAAGFLAIPLYSFVCNRPVPT